MTSKSCLCRRRSCRRHALDGRAQKSRKPATSTTETAHVVPRLPTSCHVLTVFPSHSKSGQCLAMRRADVAVIGRQTGNRRQRDPFAGPDGASLGPDWQPLVRGQPLSLGAGPAQRGWMCTNPTLWRRTAASPRACGSPVSSCAKVCEASRPLVQAESVPLSVKVGTQRANQVVPFVFPLSPFLFLPFFHFPFSPTPQPPLLT